MTDTANYEPHPDDYSVDYIDQQIIVSLLPDLDAGEVTARTIIGFSVNAIAVHAPYEDRGTIVTLMTGHTLLLPIHHDDFIQLLAEMAGTPLLDTFTEEDFTGDEGTKH